MFERLEGRTLLSSYFVSAAGSDTRGDGSESAPWRSIDRVNQKAREANGFEAGDSVRFRAGDTFAGSLLFDADDSGTAAAPLTVGSYPYGGLARASIAPRGDAPGLLFLNTAGVAVTDLRVVGSGGQTPAVHSGIEFRTDVGGNGKLDYVRVTNVEVTGFGDYGIELQGTRGKGGYNDVEIADVDVHHNTNGGIASFGVTNAASTDYAHSNVRVGHANVWRNTGWAGSPSNSGSGIMLSDVRGVTIERSVAHENGEFNTHNGGPVGIWVWDVDRALIQHNESHHNRTNSTTDGGGFDFDGGVTNSVMQYNYSHDNAGAGYGIYQYAGARPFFNNHVRYNVSVDDARKNSYGAIDFWNGNGSNGIRDTYVYNNTVHVSPSVDPARTDSSGRPLRLGYPRAVRFIGSNVQASLYNNVFQTSGGVTLAQLDADHTSPRLNGNDWHSSGSPFALNYFGKVYTSFDAYRSGTGQDRQGISASARTANTPAAAPTVRIDRIDAMGTVLSGYRSAPVVRDAAQPVGWSYGLVPAAATDFFGTPLPAGGPIDIGAHEHESAAPLAGRVIGTTGSYNNNGSTIARAVDGSLSTYFDAPAGTASGAWVGLDLGSARAVAQVRYAPRAGWASRMVGGRFQASNSATFDAGVVDLHTVAAAPAGGVLTTAAVSPPAGATYRYVRYLAPANSYGNVAEVQFVGPGGGGTVPPVVPPPPPPAGTPAKLAGATIGTGGSYNHNGNTAAKAVDGSLATYFDAPVASGAWVGLDLGSAKPVTQVRFAPRAGWASRMVGGRFQASNSATFASGAVDLHTVTTTPVAGGLTTVTVNPTGTTFRYVRYLAPAGSYGNVAEAQFFGV